MIQHFSIEGSWFEFVVLLIFLDIWWDLLIFGSWGFSRPSTDTTTTPLPIVRSRSHWKLSPHWFQASQINGRWTRLTCGCNRHQNQSTSIIQKRLHQNISTQENLHPQQFLDNSTEFYMSTSARPSGPGQACLNLFLGLYQPAKHPPMEKLDCPSLRAVERLTPNIHVVTSEVTIGFTIRSWRMTIIQGCRPQNWPKVSVLQNCVKNISTYVYGWNAHFE